MQDNIPTRNNNPGDLKNPQTGEFQQFSNPLDGKAALYNDLTAKMTGTSTTGIGPSSSLVDFAKVYAPASDKNDPIQYAANLANQLNISPDTQIGTLKSRIDDFANAISKNEGYQSQTNPDMPEQNMQSTEGQGQIISPTINTAPKPDFLDKVAGVANAILGVTGGQQISKTLGNALGLVWSKASDLLNGTDYSKYYDTSDTPSFLQNVGDIGQLGLTLAAPEVGAGEGMLARIGANAALGAGIGASHALANKGDITSEAGTGALMGGIATPAIEGISKLFSFLPDSIMSKALNGAEDDVKNSVLNNKHMWTVGSALQETNKGISLAGNKIDNILSNMPEEKNLGSGSDSLDKALIKFQQSSLFPETTAPGEVGFFDAQTEARNNLIKQLKGYVPGKGALVDKLANGDATLLEKNELRQALDKTYTTLDPESTWKKTLAKSVADNLRDEVQSWAPDTQPYFQQMTKNYGIKDALEPIAEKAGKTKGIGLYDLTAFLAGHTLGGPFGGLGAVAAERALRNPNADLMAARFLSRSGGMIGSLAKAGKAPVLNAILGGLQQGQSTKATTNQ